MGRNRIIAVGGVKHSGKSAVGRAAAKLLRVHFFDTDDLLEELYRERFGADLQCREIFRELGEDSFRQLEADAVSDLLDRAPEFRAVLALGGGAVSNERIDWRRGNIFRVMLEVDREVVRKRILGSGIPPFLGETVEEFEARFPEWFQLREAACRRWAGLVFRPDPALTPAQNAEKLCQAVADSTRGRI